MTLVDGNSRTKATPVRKSDLPEDRQKVIEFGMLQYQQVEHERDQLKTELVQYKLQLDDMRVQLGQSQLEQDSMRSLLTALESRLSASQIEADQRVRGYMLERDQVLAERQTWEDLFTAIGALMRAFNVPNAPLIRGLENPIPLAPEDEEQSR